MDGLDVNVGHWLVKGGGGSEAGGGESWSRDMGHDVEKLVLDGRLEDDGEEECGDQGGDGAEDGVAAALGLGLRFSLCAGLRLWFRHRVGAVVIAGLGLSLRF